MEKMGPSERHGTAPGRFVEAGGHTTNLHEQGTGQPLVLLHGSGPGVSAWSNWHDVIPRLSQSHRIIAPDIAGFGQTAARSGLAYNIKVWVEHFIGVLDVLGIDRASIVGNSFGGALALATALSHPDRVARLILLGTPVGEFEMTEGLKAGWLYEPGLTAMEQVLHHFPYDAGVITPDLVRTRYESSARPGAQEAFRRLVPKPNDVGPTIVKGIPESSLTKIRHKTLVLHGREDRVIPLELGLRIFRAIPNAEIHAFGRCGHWVQVERKEEFLALVTHFVGAS